MSYEDVGYYTIVLLLGLGVLHIRKQLYKELRQIRKQNEEILSLLKNVERK